MSWRRDRITERDVPESQHTIFIRGLPGSTTTDQVRDFFEDKFGEITFDFVKVSPDRTKLYVAVRFASKTSARECMDKFVDGEILGNRVELTWFRDIRRYINHCQKQGVRPSRRRERDEDYRGGRDEVKRSRTHSRSSNRSHSRGITRSPSRDRGRSVSRSPLSRSLSRSHSRSSAQSRSSPISDRRKARDGGFLIKKESISPSPPPKKIKKDKKDKKKKKRRPSPTPSRSPSKDSDMEGSEGEFPSGEIGNSLKKNIKTEIPFIPTQVKHPEIKPPTPSKSNMGFLLRNSSVTIDLDSNKLPQQKFKQGFTDEQTVLNYANANNQNGSYGGVRGSYVTSFGQIETSRNDLNFEPSAQQLGLGRKPKQENGANIVQALVPPNPPIKEEIAGVGAALTNFKAIQRDILKDVRYRPGDKVGDDKNVGTLRLSSLSKASLNEAQREEKLAKLSPELRDRVERKKLELELSYRTDCETYGFVAQKLVSKDRTLEDRLRMSLLEVMKDLESEAMKHLDNYIDDTIAITF